MQALKPENAAQRLARVTDWLERIDNGTMDIHNVIFPDEKKSNLKGEVGNVHNSRVWVPRGTRKGNLPAEMVIRSSGNFGPSVMVSIAAGSKMVSNPVFIPQGTTIDGPYYLHEMIKNRFPQKLRRNAESSGRGNRTMRRRTDGRLRPPT
eukprot:GEMP01066249.1.p1 GENE.GEMP01066249.1~~GEMP01066249.1.p1  ORF type:complete len:150 (+),score=21.69 GEMP01066249.1:385-834(+)